MSVVKQPSSDITRFLPENYVTDINTEGKIREITKIRINLQKFSGYNSKLDIHSFQSEFLMPEARPVDEQFVGRISTILS